MSEAADEPERRLLLRDSYAIRAEYHKSAGQFVFLAADGTTVTVSCVAEPAEKIEAFIVDVRQFVPVDVVP